MIGFTGTQSLDSISMKRLYELETLLTKMFLPGNYFHHGDCKGMDAYAHDLAVKIGYKIVLHPPSNNKARAYCKADISVQPKDYIKRNHDIVQSSSTLIAIPKNPLKEERRSGTWATIRYAKRVALKRHYKIIIL